MKYERLTHQKYDENIDLTQEYGHSYIHKSFMSQKIKLKAEALRYKKYTL